MTIMKISRLQVVLAVGAAMLAVSSMRTVSAQGLDTQADKNSWEEINFDFNSSVLVDGFPSLLRLGELLQANPMYKVRIEGHTDRVGTDAYNQRLGLARATTVRDFLVKYGARPAQIEVTSRGKTTLKYGPGKPGRAVPDEVRWMDRRVALTVTDAQGRTVGAGGAGDAIQALAKAAADCCNEVLHRLDKLDTLERMLKDLTDQNAGLKDQLNALKQEQDALRDQVAGLRNGAGGAGGGVVAGANGANGGAGGAGANNLSVTGGQNGPPAPTSAEVAKAVADELEKRAPKFEMLGMNVGGTNTGDATFTGKGRYFGTFGQHYAVQSEGEYFYSTGQREGQFDLGLVDRVGRFQAGLFSSFKHVNLTGDQTGGTLGQGAVTLEYLFGWGKIGAYGTKAFLDDALVNTTSLGPNGFISNFETQTYLRVVDQAGINATGPLFGKNYFEGNVGYLKSTVSGDRLGGTLRLIFPVSAHVAFTLEGGVNETLLEAGNRGRVVAGVQFGNFMRPKDYLTTELPTPVQIPRVRYEVLTRTVRTGDLAPIADAGPDQTLPGAATVTLDGSGSYDPNGDKITYQWQQIGGPAVTLSSPTTAITTFAAAAGNVYIFTLTVRDPYGLQSVARVAITTTPNAPPQILLFNASPSAIQSGQLTNLVWQVINADTVTITGIASGAATVALTGTLQIAPTVNTVYQITATKGGQTVTATTSVIVTPATVVTPPPPAANGVQIQSFTSMVLSDGMTQLYCVTKNAEQIQLAGQTFAFTTEAVLEVKPGAPTQYTCVATGFDGTMVQQSITVQ
jgi:outer membrane protein OmpA-like peptidoglycan-associated protein